MAMSTVVRWCDAYDEHSGQDLFVNLGADGKVGVANGALFRRLTEWSLSLEPVVSSMAS